MPEEKQLTSQESLELITRMINKAKQDYIETGVSALLWGAVITICTLTTYFNFFYLHSDWLEAIWSLTLIALVPQVIISRKERKLRKAKGRDDDAMGGIWLSYAISITLLSILDWQFRLQLPACVYMVLYGIPTFSTGYARNFKPMLYGGIAAWIMAILSRVTSWHYAMLWMAGSAQVAWFIPGLILRKRYLKAKKNNV